MLHTHTEDVCVWGAGGVKQGSETEESETGVVRERETW